MENKPFTLIVLLGLVTVLAGCLSMPGPSASKLNNLQIGMAKSDVIKTLGPPNNTRASEGVEYMIYALNEGTQLVVDNTGKGWLAPQNRQYFVRLRNGVVDSWGKVGDFDSAKVPETKSEIDVNVKQK